jgi:sugar transferase (PEP-CTERM system associated)
MAQPTASTVLTSSGNLIILVLLALDCLGIFAVFNFNHMVIAKTIAPNLLLTWKLILIAGFTFLYYYLMDLYTFNSPLSQLGMLERSFIAMLLIGITTALSVFVVGPSFIGGFVGRGVLASSLIMLWLWSLGIRYLLNSWFVKQQSQVKWLVVVDSTLQRFITDFRSQHDYEQLHLLSKPGTSQPELTDDDVHWVGDWNDLSSALEDKSYAGIIITSEDTIPEELVDDLMNIRISGLRIFRLSDFYEQYLARLPIFHVNPNWLATAHGFELIHNPIGLRFKRYIDIVIALLGGLLVLPVLCAAVVAIVVTSGLPALYSQTRTGENGRRFRVLKLRTMIVNAEAGGAQFAAEDDPRITRLGGVLRKFRIDEIPQLWNVLKGDMSFIGPRPERPEFIDELQHDIPYYNLRHMVKPGITGWAQVMYGYGDSSADAAEKLQYDLFYIKNYSLILDISIIIRSMKVILFGTGR